MLSNLPDVAPDPIIAVTNAFRADPRDDKIDLGIGVFKNSAGETPIFAAVKTAEQRLWEAQATKTYVGVGGSRPYLEALADAVFPACEMGRDFAAAQSVGGTGGVRIAMDIAARMTSGATAWVPQFTWGNHKAIAAACGLAVKTYAYPGHSAEPETDRILHDLKDASAGDVLVLHANCHNPTGIDLSADALGALVDLAKERGLFPLIDSAYLGFGGAFAEDSRALKALVDRAGDCAVVVSCSKNFGLYRDRVGAVFLFSDDARGVARAQANLLSVIRANYSMPPDHGAAIVETILEDDALRQSWLDELDGQRGHVAANRRAFAAAIGAQTNAVGMDYIETGRGMFSLLPISGDDVAALAAEQGVYLGPQARVNFAAMRAEDAPRLAAALAPRFIA